MNTKRAYKLQEFVAHSAAVNCLKIGRKSSRVLVTGGEDHKVNLWAIGNPNAILSLYGHSSGVDSVTFDASEGLLAAGAASGTIKLWDLEEAKDTNLKIWDIRKKGCIHTYKGHTRGVNVLRFTPDGRWTVSGGKDYVVKDFIKNLLSSASEKSMASDSTAAIEKIKQIVVINPRLHPRLPLSKLEYAVSQAIETVVPEFVKMSVRHALQKTKAHVLMAYPLGTDDLLRNNAAHMMATSLAQRYANDFCYEPLRGWMFSFLHGSFQQPGIPYETRCRIVDSIISDNLESICGGIQEIARTEVVRDIEAHVRSWIHSNIAEEKIMAIKDNFKANISVSEMKVLLDSHFGFVGDKYEALLEAIFSGVEKGFAKVLEEKKSYLRSVMEPMSEGFLLQAIENYFKKRSSVSFEEELPMVFECLVNDLSLVERDDLNSHIKNLKYETEATTSIWQSVKNLLERRRQGVTVQGRFTWIG
ncbi:uncharacterized protein LOC110227631 isoform X2 [Arabidopsis lyrata subsp. lyrata]|uniref:uncharacterized protein LOC110227631 isoform X2 n=1 Tax=Arabidopsis lyrata subsp. lyrata TaxID=81972 RepID=UPI000A29C673|nr:uncharacterized protein LOC110227631 isoform X2 [Arabidopsis lyrata subsp. lyrata]|eukprot:XP_020878157.1 uncharacterized protein LOC110227631 isoform X2 [Arabidopsis lyrata subsp. lyrata]